MDKNKDIPLLIPYDPVEFWSEIRKIIREEINHSPGKPGIKADLSVPGGLNDKPLYRIAELCQLFHVSRTTVHDWVKAGRLRKIKVASRVYFLGADIKKIIQ